MDELLTRRQLLSHSTSLGVAAASGFQNAGGPEYQVYFGDLHNHNNIGYAAGSLGRTFEIARNHLDFFAFTPHGWWNDIEEYPFNIQHKWLNGFAVVQERWPEVIGMAKKYDRAGEFVPITGFEWHSTNCGDYHILFPVLDAPYKRFNQLAELQKFAKQHRAIMIPHHPAFEVGHRGANFALLDPEVSPVVDIFSEFGSAEHDRAPHPYVRHTEGGRWTKNTLQYWLKEGRRLGVVASTDDHLGYPGAYREGLAAVWATALSREAIFDAIRHRRTYAVTGDRIRLDFRLNGHFMGEEVPFTDRRALAVDVNGWDQVDRVEILKNNQVLHRAYPMDRVPTRASWDSPVLLRFEYGWGPWPALGVTRVCDWDFHVDIENGELVDVQTCFQSGPLDEERRDKILERSPRHLRVRSFTALKDMIDDVSTKAIVLKMRGTPQSRITIRTERPAKVALSQTLEEAAESSRMLYTGTVSVGVRNAAPACLRGTLPDCVRGS